MLVANNAATDQSAAEFKPPMSFDDMMHNNPVAQPPNEVFVTATVCDLYYLGDDESYLNTPYGVFRVSTQLLVDEKIVIDDLKTFMVDVRNTEITGVEQTAFPQPGSPYYGAQAQNNICPDTLWSTSNYDRMSDRVAANFS